MQGLWRPPGQKPVSSSYAYDFQNGWGVGAGQAGGTQFEMMPGQYPGAAAPDPSVLVHPPGVQAPVGAINYTPGTGEMHPPGMPAPIDQENLTLQSGPQAPGDGVDPGFAATALRQQPVPKAISPMKQAQEILAMLGMDGDAQPAVPTGAGQSSGSFVGSGQDASGQDVGVGATGLDLQSIAQALIDTGYPAYSVYQALQGLQQSGAQPVQQGGQTQYAGPGGAQGGPHDPNSYGPVQPARGQQPQGQQPRYSADDGTGDASGGYSPEIHPVTGGYVQVDPNTGETRFVSTTGQDTGKDNPWISVGGGTIFNTDTGEFVSAPQSAQEKQQQAPTALGGGSYWNPQTGQIEQVPQSQQPNLQTRDNGDGTYTVIDMNTGQPVSQGGQQKPNMVQVQNQDGTTTVVDLNQITSGTTLGQPKNEPQNPMQTPSGDIVVWDPATGQYRKAYDETRYTTNDGSIVDVQPDGSIKYVYKGQHQFTTPDGSIVSMDPETGQYTMPFTMPEEKAPGWEVRSIQKMFPDVFTPEAMVGPEFTRQQPGGQPWKPDSPGPARGSGVMNRPPASGTSPYSEWMPKDRFAGQTPFDGSPSNQPDFTGHGLDGLLSFMQQRGDNYQPQTYDGFPRSMPGQQQSDPLAWNPFAAMFGSGQDDSSNGAPPAPPMYQPIAFGSPQPTGPPLPPVGMGQDAGGFTPPIDPQSVVGTGHRFGEPVSMEGIHRGVDLQAVRGTPALSPTDGIVSRVEDDPAGLGIQVFVRGSDGVEHALGHLDSVSVAQGDSVSAGQPVGSVGDTGAGATGPHLDYRQIDPNGQHIDPTAQLGPLAQMPRADDGSEPMPLPSVASQPVGMGQDYVPSGSSVGVGNEYIPINFGGGIGNGIGGQQSQGGGDPSFTPGGLSSFEPWVQLYLAQQQAQRQYQLDQQTAQQNWLIHQDTVKYQQDQLEAQTKYQQATLAAQQQQNMVQPYLQAAFDNPWLTRLKGQTPAWGQVGGPGGPWSPRLGASDKIAGMYEAAGMDAPPNHWPGYGGPQGGVARKNALAVSVPTSSVQYNFDPLKYSQVGDPKYSQSQIDKATHPGSHTPDITPPPNDPNAGGQPAFKWLPANPNAAEQDQYNYNLRPGQTALKNNKKRAGKFTLGVLGGVRRKAVLKGDVPFNVYAQISPFQRAGLRTDLGLNEKNFGNWQMDLRENWGKTGGPTEMPGMTMLHSLQQTPIEKEGVNQLVDTFGQTPQDYYTQQQKTWTQSAQPSVSQRA